MGLDFCNADTAKILSGLVFEKWASFPGCNISLENLKKKLLKKYVNILCVHVFYYFTKLGSYCMSDCNFLFISELSIFCVLKYSIKTFF